MTSTVEDPPKNKKGAKKKDLLLKLASRKKKEKKMEQIDYMSTEEFENELKKYPLFRTEEPVRNKEAFVETLK